MHENPKFDERHGKVQTIRSIGTVMSEPSTFHLSASRAQLFNHCGVGDTVLGCNVITLGWFPSIAKLPNNQVRLKSCQENVMVTMTCLFCQLQ